MLKSEFFFLFKLEIRHWIDRLVGSNHSLLSAKKYKDRHRNTNRKKYLLKFAGGFVIQVPNFLANSLNKFIRAYLSNYFNALTVNTIRSKKNRPAPIACLWGKIGLFRPVKNILSMNFATCQWPFESRQMFVRSFIGGNVSFCRLKDCRIVCPQSQMVRNRTRATEISNVI